MKAKVALAVLIVLVVAGALAGAKTLQIQKLIAAGESFVPPPETVSTAVAQQDQWPDSLVSIGSITAVQGVTISPELPGSVREIAFESGAAVARGDLLLRLDTTSEEAQLRALEAQTELAQLNAKRIRALRADNTVSEADLDVADSALKETAANADALRATIAKKTLRAPFAGTLGIRQVNLGEYLDPGRPVVSLQALSPVYADFALPQQELSQLKPGLVVRVTTDAYPGREFDGTLSAISPEVDASTRSVGLRATFENADQLLRPGMFARVEVRLPQQHPVLVIPATAVLSAPFGDSVFIVQPGTNTAEPPNLIVRQQFIRPGRARGDFISVESGLKPGERIVRTGVFRLRNGMSVVEDNTLTPESSTTPDPANI